MFLRLIIQTKIIIESSRKVGLYVELFYYSIKNRQFELDNIDYKRIVICGYMFVKLSINGGIILNKNVDKLLK